MVIKFPSLDPERMNLVQLAFFSKEPIKTKMLCLSTELTVNTSIVTQQGLIWNGCHFEFYAEYLQYSA
jgi:hypothetical protein